MNLIKEELFKNNYKKINLNINIGLDDYYLNPYRYNPDTNTTQSEEIIKDSKDLVDIINTLTTLVVNKETKNKLDLNDSNKKKDFNPLLFKLVANDNLNTLENILKNNKDININEQDKDGDTPLHISVFLSNTKSVKILLANGANLTIKDKWGQTPLHRICFSMGEERTLEILDMFEKKNKNNKKNNIFNLQDNYGNTVCHLVLKHIIKNKTIINSNHKKLIDKLLILTNKQIKNIDGHTIENLHKIVEKNKF